MFFPDSAELPKYALLGMVRLALRIFKLA